MTVNDKASLAKAYFEEGYNCAQSVLLAFSEEAGLTSKQAARITSTFGGGMGKLRQQREIKSEEILDGGFHG